MNNILNKLPVLQTEDILIPIYEREISDHYMIKFADLYKYTTYCQKSFQESIIDILYTHQLNDIDIAVNEALIYDYPSLLQEFKNIVIVPQSKNNRIFKLCETHINKYNETKDIKYLEFFLEDDRTYGEYNYIPSIFSQKYLAFKNLEKEENFINEEAIEKLRKMFGINETVRPVKGRPVKGQQPKPVIGTTVSPADPNTKSVVSARGQAPEKSEIVSEESDTVSPVQSKQVEPANPNTKSNVSAIARGPGHETNLPNTSIDNEKQKEKNLPIRDVGIGKEKNKPPISDEEQNYKRLEKKKIGPGKDVNKKDKAPGGIDHPNTTSPTTQGNKINKDDYIKTQGSRQMTNTINDSTDLELLVNEVYRPRRLYRHRYIRP